MSVYFTWLNRPVILCSRHGKVSGLDGPYNIPLVKGKSCERCKK